MKRTQVQFPDKLYNKLNEMAKRRETSLADVIRKASEYYLALHPEPDGELPEWEIPQPEHLGDFLSIDEDWRLLGNEGG
jgi:hypothetical protein